MPDPLGGIDFQAAAGGNQHLRAALEQLGEFADILSVRAGGQRIFNRDKQKLAEQPVPRAKIAVTGQDGVFIVEVTNPQDVQPKTVRQFKRRVNPRMLDTEFELPDLVNRVGAPLEHQVQSCRNLQWDATGDLQTYGPSSKTHLEIDDPNVERYWRLRSRRPGGEFNEWTYYEDPAVCGIVGVYSGVVRSLATNLANQATTPNGTNPLTQQGTTTRINVAASLWKAGDLVINYNSGFVDPGAYGTYYVYADDPRKAGGSVVYVATTNNSDITAADGRIYFGKITTSAGGGGTGSGGGGGGGCCPAGVMVEMFDGALKDIAEVQPGDELCGHDGGKETVQRVEMVAGMPCFRLEFANGVVLSGASSTHPLQRQGGGFATVFEVLVGDVIVTKLGASEVTVREFLGERTVYKLELDRMKTYFCDQVVCHNKMVV